MNRYEEAFKKVKSRNEMAFIPFAVAGDPDPEIFQSIVDAYIRGGADILEIGYPFSDPVADGPVNQRASIRAIASGLNHKSFFSSIKKIRSRTEIPIGLLLYYNTINFLGEDEFCRLAAGAGIDSLLVADMPPEESDSLQKAMRKYGIGRVFIVTEFTSAERMKYICNHVDSFVYVVSRPGTTGTGSELSSTVEDTIKRLKSVSSIPAAVGFGISTPDHVREVRRSGADGAIVGSALVNEIEKAVLKGKNPSAVLKKKVSEYKAATKLG